MISGRSSQHVFFAIFAMLFAISAALTILWCRSMSVMDQMPMPGGWTMSMTWMRMPGKTWAAATASFLGMWVVMMAAMMLPSLVPMLARYRQAISWTANTNLNQLTALAGAGYFLVWTAFGIAIFPLGAALATVEMQQATLAYAVPITTGTVVLIAGVVQFTTWKQHHLARCREMPGGDRMLSPDAAVAFEQGVQFGLHCGLSCANLTAILLVTGVMDLRAMILVTAAITLERLAPARKGAARAIGLVVIGAGLFLVAQAAGLERVARSFIW